MTVVFCPENADPAAFVTGARLLPRDEVALRGTFPNMNRTIKAKRAYRPERDGIVYIPIGDDRSDLYKEGWDATDGKAARNEGNYGVTYRFEIPTRGETPTHLWLSPLGGVYAGAVRVRCGDEERLVATPTDRLFFGEKSPGGLPEVFDREMKLTPDFELADLGLFPAGEKIIVEYSPPGASNLPALLILAPGDGKTAAANACRTEEEE